MYMIEGRNILVYYDTTNTTSSGRCRGQDEEDASSLATSRALGLIKEMKK